MMRQVALLAVALCATSSLAFLTPASRPVRSRCGVRDRVLQMSGVERNPNFGKLMGGYLFPEIARRRSAFLQANPEAKIISLGIGDTTQPIPPHILSGLVHGASKLGTPPGYSGYGPDQGVKDLREKIASTLYGNRIDPDDVFVSDGAKCDIGRLQVMFGKNVVTAVQDPSYPVYVDTAVIMGQTGLINEQSRQFDGIVYMPCNPGNDFFPDLAALPQRPDVIYFCSPNNPTGVAATRPQLEALVSYAREQGSVIVFDAAYAPFIRDPSLPKSIFEIEGALECAIEVNSFSKYAGFTGVRLGWTVVPKQLKFRDGSSMHADFNRMMSTTFNGASNIVQDGGLAILDKEGLAEIQTLISYYLTNAAKLRATVEAMGYKAYGGDNGPYVYVDLGGKSSWDVFSEILEKAQIVTTPGAGFGPGGEGFLRLSAFASKENVDEACERLQKVMVK